MKPTETIEQLKHRIAELENYIEDMKYPAIPQPAAVPDAMPADRADWTTGQWASHFGGRHKDNNLMNYYEFGSLMAVDAMMQRFGLVQRQVGWNMCRDAMLSAAPVPQSQEAKDAERWSAEPPTEQGWYWHWDGVEYSSPVPISVLYSGSTRSCFVSAGQLGITQAIDCSDYLGFWMPMRQPDTDAAMSASKEASDV